MYEYRKVGMMDDLALSWSTHPAGLLWSTPWLRTKLSLRRMQFQIFLEQLLNVWRRMNEDCVIQPEIGQI